MCVCVCERERERDIDGVRGRVWVQREEVTTPDVHEKIEREKNIGESG